MEPAADGDGSGAEELSIEDALLASVPLGIDADVLLARFRGRPCRDRKTQKNSSTRLTRLTGAEY
eukprot:COSAG04_NODE_4134_length_2277_cov_472.943985_2_plen_65_part_00